LTASHFLYIISFSSQNNHKITKPGTCQYQVFKCLSEWMAKIVLGFLFFCFLGFFDGIRVWLRASCLLGSHSTTWAILPVSDIGISSK
jgi:hypothetical protein